MNIAIIGSGNIGGALAQRFIENGHRVSMGIRLPLSEKSRKLLDQIGPEHFTSINEAVAQSEVIVVAVPPENVIDILTSAGNLTGKIIIDTTNSVRNKPAPFPTAFHAIQATWPETKIVKCFNSTGFENLLNPLFKEEKADMFMAGDNEEANQIASKLSLELGFGQCYYFGGSDKVELLEKLALVWINLAIMQGYGRNMAFKLLTQ